MSAPRIVAALYIDPKGPYPTLPGVEAWDEARDATRYLGPHGTARAIPSWVSKGDQIMTNAEKAIETTYQARSWDLGDGTLVSLQLPAKLSKGNIEKLKKYVGALEIEASIAWDDDGGEKT